MSIFYQLSAISSTFILKDLRLQHGEYKGVSMVKIRVSHGEHKSISMVRINESAW